MHVANVLPRNPSEERQLQGNYHVYMYKMFTNSNDMIVPCLQQQSNFCDVVVHQGIQGLDKHCAHRMDTELLLGQDYLPPHYSRLEQHLVAPYILDLPFLTNDDPPFLSFLLDKHLYKGFEYTFLCF